MNISLVELKIIVRNGYTGNRFELPLSRLRSSTVDTLADDYFPAATLVLVDVEPAEESDDGNSITVRGQGDVLPFTGMAVAVRFFLADNKAAFHLIGTGGLGWSFAQSFPVLAGTVANGFAWAAAAPPQLQLLSLDGGLATGIVFNGSLDLDESVGGLASMLGRKEQPLTGALTVKEGGRSLWAVQIEAPVSDHIDLGIATVKQLILKVGSRGYFDVNAWRFVAVPFVGLSAHIPFQARGKNYAIPVSAEITDLVRDFRIQADITDAIDAGLHELSSLTQGVSLGDFIPNDFHLEDVLRMNELSFNFNATAPKKLTAVRVGVESTSPWQILHLDASNKDLTVENVKLSLLVGDPLGNKIVFAALSGELVFGTAGRLILGAEYPDFQVYGYLQEGTTLHLNELIADFLGPAAGATVPVVEIFSLSFTVGSGQYALAAEVYGAWEIGPFSLLSIRFALSRDTGGTLANFAGLISVAGVTVQLSADYVGAGQGWTFQGGTSPGQKIPIGDLISDLIDMFGEIELPEVLESLEITDLQVSFNTATKDFHFVAETALKIDDKDAALSLNIDIVNSTAGFQKTFSGILTVGSRKFSVLFDSTPSMSFLNASFSNPEGEQIHLINDLLDLISQDPGLQVNDEFNLLEFTLYDLELSFEKNKSNGQKTYAIKGDFGWNPNVKIGDSKPLQLRATINLRKPSDGKLAGSISGAIQTPIPDLEFLHMEAFYQFSDTASSLGLRLRLGDVILQADYSSAESELDFSVKTTTPLTFSKIMNFFARLVDPSIDSFAFDPPWDTFTEVEIPINDFVFSFNTSTKKIEMVYDPSAAITIPGLPASLLEIKKITLNYEKKSQTISGRSKPVKKLDLTLEAKFLGTDQPLNWDPIDEAPPEIPGQGASAFELRYLGMGQHIAFTQADQVTSIKEVMDLLRGAITDRETLLKEDRSLTLRNPLETFGGGVIAFSPESEWLIGLDVSLLKTLSLTIIFNDPVIYGLRIELYGEHAKNFAGLQFEILYQRISDTIGKYHVDLTLPDQFRYFQVGAVSVTLPLIVVDVFTNGDFKVDLGFPWDFNFSRSFAIELFPFTGAGGFYLNKLSAATTTVVPTGTTAIEIAEKGVFTPVYEFGLGLRMGLGKSFRSGPLNAEIQITVQGMIEGVISWYNPIQPAGERELYYKIGGGVAIVGRLYGEVDFGIISVSIEVIAKAMIIFLVEVYQPIQILLSADVSVKASVKVAFIKVSFSFGLRVEQEFTIPSPLAGPAPWLIDE